MLPKARQKLELCVFPDRLSLPWLLKRAFERKGAQGGRALERRKVGQGCVPASPSPAFQHPSDPRPEQVEVVVGFSGPSLSLVFPTQVLDVTSVSPHSSLLADGPALASPIW